MPLYPDPFRRPLLVATFALLAPGACSDSGHGVTHGPAALGGAGDRRGADSGAQPPSGSRRISAPGENTRPEIDFLGFDPTSPTSGHPFLKAVVEASDADGDPLFFRYDWLLNGEPRHSGSPVLPLDGLARGERIEVRVSANDGKSESLVATFSKRLANSPPEITSVSAASPGDVTTQSELRTTVEVRDHDGDAVSVQYTWSVNGRKSRESGPTLSTRRLKRGDTIQLRAIPHDGELDGAPFDSEVWEIANSPPRIVSVPGPLGGDGVFHYAIEAEDDDAGDAPRLSLEDAPDGVVLDSTTGTLHWAPSADQLGVHSITIAANDGAGGVGRQRIEVRVDTPAELSPAAMQP